MLIKAALSLVLILSVLSAYSAEVDGAATYKKKCRSCHGKDGSGNAFIGKALKIEPEKLDLAGIAEKSDEQVMEIISKGRNKMAAFGSSLSEEERFAVLAYLRSLIPQKKSE